MTLCRIIACNVSAAWRRSGKSKRIASILHERSQCCESLAKLRKKSMLTALAAKKDGTFNLAVTPLFCQTACYLQPLSVGYWGSVAVWLMQALWQGWLCAVALCALTMCLHNSKEWTENLVRLAGNMPCRDKLSTCNTKIYTWTGGKMSWNTKHLTCIVGKTFCNEGKLRCNTKHCSCWVKHCICSDKHCTWRSKQ